MSVTTMAPDATHEGKHTFKVTVKMTRADNSSESAAMVDVNAWVAHQGKQVAKCHGNLIKRELMRDPRMFPYLMEVTQELEEMAKDYEIFHSDLNGTMTSKVMVEYFDSLGFFHDVDYTIYRQTQEYKDHPCNRAWILYFNTVTVDEGFRRQNVGRMLVRHVLDAGLRDALAAGQPLLAGVRPGFLETDNGDEAVSVKFWRAMGFQRYSSDIQPDLFFWGVRKGLADEVIVKTSPKK